jgi:dTMP kinase
LRGWFITFEGVEGAGKSTQAGRLAEALRDRGYAVLETREPGGTPLGRGIRELVLGAGHRPVPMAELLLMLADRAQHLAEVVRPALAAGKVIIGDRYADATYAYQGGGRGLDHEVIATANAATTGGLEPDLTLFLDLPVDAARARQRARGAPDRMEAEGPEFHARVDAAYRTLVAAFPYRIKIIDAGADADTVHEAVLRQVLAALEAGPAGGGRRSPR